MIPLKRQLFFVAALLSMLCACHTNNGKKQTPVMRSGTQALTYVINGDTFVNAWSISPKLRPDRLSVECVPGANQVTFISDTDTLHFSVKLHDTIPFIVLFNGDTAFTEIIGEEKNVRFTDDYVRRHKGRFEVAVPEVHELVNILVALSRIGQLDSNMIDMTTPYYREVMQHFRPFAKHSVIDTLNAHITGVLDEPSYVYYYALKMNACAYVFNDKGQVENAGVIRRMGFDRYSDPVEDQHGLLSDFAARSHFREFYKAHQPYYDSLVAQYRQLNPIDEMCKWLKQHFAFDYGNYTVLFSPLIGGAHATKGFMDNGFTQTFMFVCRAENDPRYSRNMNEMMESRVVFTEIDHNFVNPVSEQKLAKVNAVFADRDKWVKKNSSGTSAYHNAYMVFNEYMTWGVFSLYCIDRFPAKDAEQFIGRMEKQMVDSRCFIRFRDFNRYLVNTYRAHPGIGMSELCDLVLQHYADEK